MKPIGQLSTQKSRHLSSISRTLSNGGGQPESLSSQTTTSSSGNLERDEGFVKILRRILQSKQSWRISLSNSFIVQRLNPRHVEELLLQTLDQPRLALRFFNFLGLHKSFEHSTLSFCILICALIRDGLNWPASSLIQTLVARRTDPFEAFNCLLRSRDLSSLQNYLPLELLIQTYVHNHRVFDALTVFNSAISRGIQMEVRVYYLLFRGLTKIKRFDLALMIYADILSIGVRPDGFVYTEVVKILCELKNIPKAKEAILQMEEHGKNSSVVPYNVLIHGLCKVKKAVEGVEILRSLKSKGLAADLVTYCTLILGLCKVDEITLARNMLEEMLELGFNPSEAALSAAVEGLRRNGKTDEAIELVHRLGNQGIAPNLFSFNGLVDYLCKNGRLQEADELLEKMREKGGLLPNGVTYAILIDSSCRRGEIDHAVELFCRMREERIKISVYPFNSLINGFCKLGKLREAESLFREIIKQGLIPSPQTYTSMISGYCEINELDNALKLHREMSSKGVNPNAHTFTALISGFCKANMMTQSADLFKEMVELNVIPNEVTYNVMIDGYCRAGDISTAFTLYHEMQEKGLVPDTFTFRPLISGLCLAGRVSEAKCFVDGLFRKNHKLNEMCLGALAHGYCKEGKVEDATQVFKEMVGRGIEMDLVCYSSLIYGALKQNDHARVLDLLRRMDDEGLKLDSVVFTSMVDAQFKRGDLTEAMALWYMMVKEGLALSVVSYTVIIDGLCKAGREDKALVFCKEMLVKDFHPNVLTFGCLLDHLMRTGRADEALHLHEVMIRAGRLCNSVTYNIVMSGLCKIGRVQEATLLLEEMIENGIIPDCVSYSIIIFEQCKKGDLPKAFSFWNAMLEKGIEPDSLAFNFLIRACCLNGQLSKAIDLHDDLARRREKRSQLRYTHYYSAYTLKHNGGGRGVHAEKGRNFQFPGAFLRSVFFFFFFSFGSSLALQCRSALQRAAQLTVKQLLELHAVLVTAPPPSLDPNLVAVKLITAYAAAGAPRHSALIFSVLPSPNLFAWNAVLKAHAQNNLFVHALRYFSALFHCPFAPPPDEYTFTSVLKACAGLLAIADGEKAHALLLKLGLHSNLFVQNSLIDLYFKLRRPANARHLFDQMPSWDAVSFNTVISGLCLSGDIAAARAVFDGMGAARTVVSWSAMVSGHARSGDVVAARRLFDDMPARTAAAWNAMLSAYLHNDMPVELVELFRRMPGPLEEATLVIVLAACARLGALELGRWLHAYARRRRLPLTLFLGNALVDMYAKCGGVGDARAVFDDMQERDVVSWTVLVAGLAANGRSGEAVAGFREMVWQGVRPNELTFMAVLSACSHAGLVDAGLEIFNSMAAEHGIAPKVEHYGCMVDLLSRAGRLQAAEELVRGMAVPANVVVWGALLGGCRTHGDASRGQRAAQRILELDPGHSGGHVYLAGAYAVAGRAEMAAACRTRMRQGRVEKVPGCSWIELDGAVHEFFMGDWSHPESQRIRALAAELGRIASQDSCRIILESLTLSPQSLLCME
ncbi:pentatricopeptide repeat (PPR) superfamily protein [Wolffia australiana]